ncbi:MAG: pitrilysin family protein [Polyangia bacterium]
MRSRTAALALLGLVARAPATTLTVTLLLGVAASSARAQDLASFEKRTTVKILNNGLTVIVVERPEAPVFSYFTHVDVGGAQEAVGQTGLAHMFEHMAFKGTDKIGSKNYGQEKALIDKVEKAYKDYDLERRKRFGRDEAKIAKLRDEWKKAIDEADKLVQPNEFAEVIDRNGGTGLNAFTNSDETGYFFSMPSNRFELWAYLESERNRRPVMRQFYQERDVVNEERRMRTDSNPIGRMIEQLLAAAFTAHPYGRPVVGWPSDLDSFSATDALRFWETYYTPANKCMTIVGDVKAAEALPVIEAYFGRLPKGPKPPEVVTTEPRQLAERQVILREASQPFYAEGYHRPDYLDKDDAVYDAIGDLLSTGRTSRLYRSLVRDQKIAAQASGFPGFPGKRYANLFIVFGVPTPGTAPLTIREALHRELSRLKTELITDDELQMVRTRAKVNLLRSLRNNQGLAIALSTAQQRYGDWREVFRRVERIEKVTKEDIRRVANLVFTDGNRTAAWIETAAPAGSNNHSGAGAGKGGK